MLNIRAFSEHSAKRTKPLNVYSCLLHDCYNLGAQARQWRLLVDLCACLLAGPVLQSCEQQGCSAVFCTSQVKRHNQALRSSIGNWHMQNRLQNNWPMGFIRTADETRYLGEGQSTPCGPQITLLVGYADHQWISSGHCSFCTPP